MICENERIKKYKGRPLFDTLHKINQTSLLSHKALEIDMKGFFNLLVIIIFSINFRLVLENFKKYGLIIQLPKDFSHIKRNLPLLFCFCCMHICILFSWFIERYVTTWLYNRPPKKGEEIQIEEIKKKEKKEEEEETARYQYMNQIYNGNDDDCDKGIMNNTEKKIEKYKNEVQNNCKEEIMNNTIEHNRKIKSNVKLRYNEKKKSIVKMKIKKSKKVHGWKNFHFSLFLLTLINSLFILLFPFLTVRYYNTEPIFSTVLLSISIVWFFKFYSFHHVCYDIRKLYTENEDIIGLDNWSDELKHIRTYPYCLSLKNYYTFILMPTMCFQFNYPRTKKIRWLHVFKHIVEVLFLLIMIKIISEQYIFITVKNTFTMKEFQSANFSVKVTHIIERMLKLSIPTLYIWLIGFLIIFHHWCNILAEVTKFGDRLFYNDWWNASSFAEYWRKWNLPIHYFVNRHINKPLIYNGVSRKYSVMIVFFISAVLHEYLINTPLKLGWTGYIFFAFICQIPLVHLTNNDFFKKHKTIGNSIFWIVFCFTGQPLVLFIYYYLWQAKQGIILD